MGGCHSSSAIAEPTDVPPQYEGPEAAALTQPAPCQSLGLAAPAEATEAIADADAIELQVPGADDDAGDDDDDDTKAEDEPTTDVAGEGAHAGEDEAVGQRTRRASWDDQPIQSAYAKQMAMIATVEQTAAEREKQERESRWQQELAAERARQAAAAAAAAHGLDADEAHMDEPCVEAVNEDGTAAYKAGRPSHSPVRPELSDAATTSSNAKTGAHAREAAATAVQ